MRCARITPLGRPLAIAAALLALAGCSNPSAGPAVGSHAYELALAWAAGASTDGFHFPISCPGPPKLVLFRASRFELSCDARERITGTSMDVVPDEPAGEEAAAPRARPALDCYLVVVARRKDIAGVLTDMRRDITARRSGPLDCALIRYD